jgi:RNA polymerase sigma-70 factor, ECF subfamily
VTIVVAEGRRMMRLTGELAPDVFEALLEEYQRLVREVFERMGGGDVDVDADTITAAFPTARAAVLAAVATQHAVAGHDWPHERKVAMSMGLDSSADRCAELSDAAERGQIFLTPAVARELEQETLGSLSVRDLGEVQLRRRDRGIRAYELVYPAAGTYDARMPESRSAANPDTRELEERLEQYRPELRAYCYRMLGSPFEADDAVQETLIRAWRGLERFEGRAALRSWLYRIATNVCLDMLSGRERRARPMDLGPSWDPGGPIGRQLPEVTWVEPVPDDLVVAPEGDPAQVAESRETIRLAFVAALQHLPPRQRAVLILCEVLRWKASEVAELLETSVASVNSALQRARATLEASNVSAADATPSVDKADAELLARYVEAFEAYDMDALAALIQEDAQQSMPPYELWLSGRDDIFAWWLGPGIGCRGSRMIPTLAANGAPAFGQYKPKESGDGYEPWALQVLEVEDGKIVELTFFLDTETLFPLFGLPARLDS